MFFRKAKRRPSYTSHGGNEEYRQFVENVRQGHEDEISDTDDLAELYAKYRARLAQKDWKPLQPSLYIRVGSSVSIPEFLDFHHSFDALNGWSRYFYNSKCEVYYMRRSKITGRDEWTKEDKWRLKQQQYWRKERKLMPILEMSTEKDGEMPEPENVTGRSNQEFTAHSPQMSMKKSGKVPANVTGGEDSNSHQQQSQEIVQYIQDIDDYSRKGITRSRVDPPTRVVYYIYKAPVDKRQRILQYAAFTIGHLGVFAFLFQVFDDRGVTMRICCYSQLLVLLLCFLTYAFLYFTDFTIIQSIKRKTKEIEKVQRKELDLQPNGVGRYMHCIYAVKDFSLSRNQSDLKAYTISELEPSLDLSGNHNYIFPLLDLLFAVFMMMVEFLTIIYIHNNTQGENQGQGDTP